MAKQSLLLLKCNHRSKLALQPPVGLYTVTYLHAFAVCLPILWSSHEYFELYEVQDS